MSGAGRRVDTFEGPSEDGPSKVVDTTLAAVSLLADSTVTWLVGYVLALVFLMLPLIPYLVARRYGAWLGWYAAAAWSVVGIVLTLAYGDLAWPSALALGLLAFGGPWLLAAFVGGRSYQRLSS